MGDDMKDLLTTKQLAQHLKVSPRVVRTNRVKYGGVLVGRRWRFDPDVVWQRLAAATHTPATRTSRVRIPPVTI
jgi:hypothetical protein